MAEIFETGTSIDVLFALAKTNTTKRVLVLNLFVRYRCSSGVPSRHETLCVELRRPEAW